MLILLLQYLQCLHAVILAKAAVLLWRMWPTNNEMRWRAWSSLTKLFYHSLLRWSLTLSWDNSVLTPGHHHHHHSQGTQHLHVVWNKFTFLHASLETCQLKDRGQVCEGRIFVRTHQQQLGGPVNKLILASVYQQELALVALASVEMCWSEGQMSWSVWSGLRKTMFSAAGSNKLGQVVRTPQIFHQLMRNKNVNCSIVSVVDWRFIFHGLGDQCIHGSMWMAKLSYFPDYHIHIRQDFHILILVLACSTWLFLF